MALANTQTSARWVATTNTLSTQVGTNASGTINLTISNIVNGVYSGYNLRASLFKIGGASGPVVAGGGFKWTGGNVDSVVNYVIFTDNGTAGDPANTVNAAITLNSTSVTSSNMNLNVYVDIDDITPVTDEPEIPIRSACLDIVFPNPFGSDQTVQIEDLTGITETTLTPGVSSYGNLYGFNVTGTVLENMATKIAKITFTANGNHYYPFTFGTNIPAVAQFQNITQSSNGYADYTNNYTYQISDKVFDSAQRLTSWSISVFYTPPTTGPGAVDPAGGLCPMDHRLFVEYALYGVPTSSGQGKTVDTGGNINSAVIPTDIPSRGGQKRLVIKGQPGSQYTIKVVKTTGLESNTVASSGGYYNFDDDAFVDTDTSSSGTILSNGQSIKYVNIPAATTDTRYDVIIGSSSSSTLASAVPSASGDAKMTQKAPSVFTLGVTTGTSANFGTLPTSTTITKPSTTSGSSFFYQGTSYEKVHTKGSTELRGQSKGVSTTRLIIEDKKFINKIKPGMSVRGDGIVEGVTVVSVDRRSNRVVLSSAQTINNKDLTFESSFKDNNFSFTITPGEGKTLAVNTNNSIYSSSSKIFGAPQSIVKKVKGAVTDSSTVVLDDYEQVLPGMAVSGDGVEGGITVSSLQGISSIVLSSAQNIADEVDLNFTGGVGNVYLTRESVLKVGNNIVISGSLRCESLDASITCNINIDNLINVS